MFGVFRKPGEEISYKYRLNSNYKEKNDSVCLNGVYVYKDRWASYPVSQEKEIRMYIKNYKNPEGIVDEYVFDPLKEFKEPEKNLKFKHRKKQYSRDVLCTFTRKEIEEISREYGIDHVKKVTNFLINKILEKQEENKRAIKESEGFFDENNKM